MREILDRHTANLSIGEIDWLVTPKSKSIGETLLHISGFEYLIVCAIKLGKSQTFDAALWHDLKPGFAREAGFEAPRNSVPNVYSNLLELVRKDTVDFLRSHGPLVSKEEVQLSALCAMLQASSQTEKGDGSSLESDPYDRLFRAVENSFLDDAGPKSAATFDLISLLNLHETYHRGQITLLRYLYRCQQEALGERMFAPHI
ncbi:MAG: hypothetical protein C0469_16340 [Cyanobacteria bacterium DS2.3.42]|nr:hypothetical protein [Cyanobacteria bacterium DS2.3.42]